MFRYLFLAAVFLLQQVMFSQSRNLLPFNAGFETGVSGWRCYISNSRLYPDTYNYPFNNPAIKNTGAPEGRSYVCISPGKGLRYIFESFAVRLLPGKTYTLSAWMQCPAGNAHTEIFAGSFKKSVELTTQWVRQSFSFTVQEDDGKPAHIGFSIQTAPVNIDAVQLEEGNMATGFSPVSEIEAGGETGKKFSLYNQNESGTAHIKIFSHAKNSRTLDISFVTQDYELKTIASDKTTMTILPDSLLELSLPLKTNLKGGFRLAVYARDRETGVSAFYPVVYAVIPEPVVCKNPGLSPFCTETYHNAGNIGVFRVYYGYTTIDEFQELMQRLGIHGTREQLWKVSPELLSSKEPVDWYDGWLSGLNKRNIVSYNWLNMSTLWGDSDVPFKDGSRWKIPEESSIRWNVRKVTEHYKGRFQAYEIGWETESWATPENFAKVASWMVDEIRKSDPDAKIIGVCPTLDTAWAGINKENSWLGKTLPLVRGLFDDFTAHLYYQSESGDAEYSVDDPPAGMPGYDDIITGMNELLVKNGFRPGAWSDTENGYAGSTMYAPLPASQFFPDLRVNRLQAENAVKKMLTGLTLGIRRWHYFIFNCYIEHDMSFFEWNMTPRPLTAAWCQLSQRIENLNSVNRIPAGRDIRAYYAERDNDACIIYWHKNCRDGITCNPGVDLSRVSIEDIMGNKVPVNKPAAGIPLSRTPYYISGTKKDIAKVKEAFLKLKIKGDLKPKIKLTEVFSGKIPQAVFKAINISDTLRHILSHSSSCALINSPKSLCLLKFEPEPGAIIYTLINLTADSACVNLTDLPDGARVFATEPAENSSHVYTNLKCVALDDKPLFISESSSGTKQTETLISRLIVEGKPDFQISRISLGNEPEKFMPAVAASVKNTGAVSISGKIHLTCDNKALLLNQEADFDTIPPGEERLVWLRLKHIPDSVSSAILSGEISVTGAEKRALPEQKILIVKCPYSAGFSPDAISAAGVIPSLSLRHKDFTFGTAAMAHTGIGKHFYFIFDFRGNSVNNSTLTFIFDAEPAQNLFDLLPSGKTRGKLSVKTDEGIDHKDRIKATSGLYTFSDLFSPVIKSSIISKRKTFSVGLPLNNSFRPGKIIGFNLTITNSDSSNSSAPVKWTDDTIIPPEQGFIIFE